MSIYLGEELEQVLVAQQTEFPSPKNCRPPSIFSNQKHILKSQQLPENFPQ